MWRLTSRAGSGPGTGRFRTGFITARNVDGRAVGSLVAIDWPAMLRSPIVRLVDLCARHAWPVIILALALTCFSGVYAARHFAIKTDPNDLFPPTLAWTERALAYMKAFPQRDILVVVDAPTEEFADAAAAKLTADLTADHEHFRTV